MDKITTDPNKNCWLPKRTWFTDNSTIPHPDRGSRIGTFFHRYMQRIWVNAVVGKNPKLQFSFFFIYVFFLYKPRVSLDFSPTLYVVLHVFLQISTLFRRHHLLRFPGTLIHQSKKPFSGFCIFSPVFSFSSTTFLFSFFFFYVKLDSLMSSVLGLLASFLRFFRWFLASYTSCGSYGTV